MDTAFSELKRPSSLLSALSSKPASLIVCGYTSDYGIGSLRFWKVTTSTERYIQVLEHHMFPDILFREGLAYFRKTVLNHIFHLLALWLGFVVQELGCWASACNPDLSPTETNWNIMKQKNMTKTTRDYQTRMRQRSFLKTPATGLQTFKRRRNATQW